MSHEQAIGGAVIPARPALRYYGSKFNLAPWIISHWPRHNVRVLPFCGGLNEELRAQPVKLTTAADLDGRVLNFFAMLRDNRDELVRLIRLTPWHEKEYELSKVTADTPLEDARRFFFHCWMSVQGGPNPGKSGFRIQKSVDSRFMTPASDAININHLYAVAERLKGIQFLHRDAREIIELFTDTNDCLIFCDPPYLHSTRAHQSGYAHDSNTALHVETAGLLNKVKGYAIVCGYSQDADGKDNEIYRELYAGWTRSDKEARTNSGGKRIESLWLSPRTWQALQDERRPSTVQQMTLWSNQ